MSKKAAPAPPKTILGRPGNHVSIGIVGMPNVGKSTLYNLLSKQNVPAENYAFCTIDPNTARVPVPDARFDHLCDLHKPDRTVPAFLTCTDIAGLVKGAHEGKGLGNAFLSHISAVDGIFHVCRAFKDDTIEHVEGSVDPIRDIQIITEELALKDLQVLDKLIAEARRLVERGADKTKKADLDCYLKCQEMLKNNKEIRNGEWTNKEIEILIPVNLLTAKPVVYLCNISENDFLNLKNNWIPKIQEWIKVNSPGSVLIPFSAAFERKWETMSEEQRDAIVKERKVRSMLPKIIHEGYKTLQLIHYFTAGSDEVKCWTIRSGTKAPQAAGVIHTDFERGFIAAEVMMFDEFKEAGSEAALRAAGKYRAQGKDYVVQDGDIIFFKFNVTASAAKKK